MRETLGKEDTGDQYFPVSHIEKNAPPPPPPGWLIGERVRLMTWWF